MRKTLWALLLVPGLTLAQGVQKRNGPIKATTGTFSGTLSGVLALAPGCYTTALGLIKDTRNLAAYYTDASGALQSCSANKLRVDANGPVLEAAATNLLTYSQITDNVAWNKSSFSWVDSLAGAPDGTATASSLMENANSTSHNSSQNYTFSATPYTLSRYVKPIGRQWCKLMIYDGTNFKSAWFDVLNGVVGSKESGVTSSAITSAGNGWYRISMVRTPAAGTGGAYFHGALADGGADNYAGDAAKGYYVWGAQLETGALSSYIPTTTASVQRPADALSFVQ
jgi:hypothetical protein